MVVILDEEKYDAIWKILDFIIINEAMAEEKHFVL